MQSYRYAPRCVLEELQKQNKVLKFKPSAILREEYRSGLKQVKHLFFDISDLRQVLGYCALGALIYRYHDRDPLNNVKKHEGGLQLFSSEILDILRDYMHTHNENNISESPVSVLNTVMNMNDAGKNFLQIADYLESVGY